MSDTGGQSPIVKPNLLLLKEGEILPFTKSLPLFQKVSPDAIQHVLKRGQVFEYPQQGAVFHEGQQGEHLYVVLKGRVAIYVKDELVSLCRAGQSFGEVSPLAKEARSATAVADGGTVLLALGMDALESLARDGYAIRFLLNVIHACYDMLQTSNAEVTRLRRRLEEFESGR